MYHLLRAVIASMVLAGSSIPALAAELTPRQIYGSAAPGVVVVAGIEDQGTGSTGTGAIIAADGVVFTNAHVVVNKDKGKPFSQVLVILRPDRVTGRPDHDYSQRAKARVLSFNRELDLAVLKFEPASKNLRVLPLGNPEGVQIGDWVAAIGHPEQGGLWTFTTGVVSAEFEDFQNTKGKHVFQTEIGMNRGNSGGPLLDSHGHVIGVNTSMARLAPDGLPITSISFSVKSSVLKKWLNEQGIQVAYSTPPATKPSAPKSSVATEPVSPGSPPPSVPTIPHSPPASSPSGPAKPVKAAPAQPADDPQAFKTEARPYDPDRLLDEVRRLESELESLAEEMRTKIRKGR